MPRINKGGTLICHEVELLNIKQLPIINKCSEKNT